MNFIYSMFIPMCRSLENVYMYNWIENSLLLGRRLDVNKHTWLSITLVNKESYLMSLKLYPPKDLWNLCTLYLPACQVRVT